MPSKRLEQAVAADRCADYQGAMEHILACEALLKTENAPMTAPIWGEVDVLGAELQRFLGNTALARERAVRAVKGAQDHGWEEVLPDALRTLGRIEQREGDPRRTHALLERALGLFEARGDRLGQGRVLRDLAIWSETAGDRRAADRAAEASVALVCDVPYELAMTLNVVGDSLRARGDLPGATAVFEEARAHFETLGHGHGLARSLDGLALVAHQMGRYEEVITLENRAVELYQSIGYTVGIAEGRNLLGDAYRLLDRLEEAEHAYLEALEGWRSLGSIDSVVPEVNLALTQLARGNYAQAEPRIRAMLATCIESERRGFEGLCRVFLLAPCVAGERFDEWEEHYGRGVALLAETGEVDRDVAWAAQLSARLSEERGEPADLSRAVRSRSIALDQWQRLGIEAEGQTERRALGDLALQGADFPVGAFDIVGSLGQGAMGDVWRGIHREQGVEVAIKVLHAVYRKQRASFDAEVRAVARLDHPSIVRVLDHGIVDLAADAMTGGRIAEGSPYFAMEIARRGTLDEMCGKLDWPTSRQVLLALLDALAHAHARGVLHLDLKPGNIILDESDDGTPVVRLTDFGLAGVMAAHADQSIVMGTPAYMAPEQFRGDRRDFGPWTDLYALGCVAVQLVTGVPVFGDGVFADLSVAHLQREPPPLPAGIAAPFEFEEWVERLLEKSIHRRFRRAADAAFALQRMKAVRGSMHELPTELLDVPGATALGNWTASAIPAVARVAWAESLPDVPPVPVNWKPLAEHEPVASLSGAGKGLVGLRSGPLVGREREQGLLWLTFRDAVARCRGRAVVLTGTAGVGRTRLADWIAERSHELGVATPIRGAGDWGLREVMTDFFGCQGLEPAECHARIHALIRTEGLSMDITAMAGFVSGVATLAPEEKIALVARIISRLSRRRPVVVVLDDVVSVEMMELAHHLAGSPSAVVVVVTVCDDRLSDHPLTADRLEALLDGDDTLLMELARLPDDLHLALVQQLLPLEAGLAAEIAERTGGNPRFAVQVVGDLVRRDQLVPRPQGFMLRGGVSLRVPDDVHTTCRGQLERAQRGLAAETAEALAVAAVLGPRVSTQEWLAATADLPSGNALLEALIAHRLVHAEDGRWSFVNAMLGHAALRMAEEAGTARDARLAVVLMLGNEQPGRRGQLLSDAGEWEACVDPLEEGARRRIRIGDYDAAISLLSRRDRALDRLGEPKRGERRITAILLRAQIDFDTLAYESSRKNARLALRAAEHLGLGHPRACALQRLGHLNRLAGKLDRAEQMFEEALEAFRKSTDATRAGSCLHGLAHVARVRGDLDRSLGLLRDAVTWLEDADDPELAELVVIGLGQVHKDRGELDAADRAFAEALRRAEARGAHTTAIEALVGTAEVDRLRGDPAAAVAAYRRALDLAPAALSARSMMCRLHLGVALLSEGLFSEAAAEISPWIPELEQRGRAGLLAFARVLLLAATGDLAALPGAEEALRDSRLWDPDVAWALELAGDRAREDEVSRRAWRLAEAQYRGLGREGDADRIAELVASSGLRMDRI